MKSREWNGKVAINLECPYLHIPHWKGLSEVQGHSIQNLRGKPKNTKTQTIIDRLRLISKETTNGHKMTITRAHITSLPTWIYLFPFKVKFVEDVD